MTTNVILNNEMSLPPSDIRLGMIEMRPFRPFKSSEEYLYAMKEDLAEWLKGLYEVGITADNFCEMLETGVILCRHANKVQRMALEYLRGDPRCRLPYPIPAKEVTYREHVQPATFQARDNVSNFISWCRALQIIDCLLFETDDLVLRKNEKSFILCLLEVARRGSKVGMPAPLLVQMEEEIDREIARDNAKRMRDSGVETDPLELEEEPPSQIITNDLKSLDEMVRDLVNRCTCRVQFPMIRISEGKYRIGDTKILIFVRILRSHVMVRVGGGWDTLAHYLDKHDPCRCRQGHRATISSRLTVKYPTNPGTNNSNFSNQTQMEVTYMRSPVPSTGNQATLGNGHHSPPSRNRSISPVHHHHHHQQQQESLPRQRRASASSASSSSHELSNDLTNESSALNEPVNLTVGSVDSSYSSIRVTSPNANDDSDDCNSIPITTSPPINGLHDVTDFGKGIPLASTPKENALTVNKTENEHKSRIPTCAEVVQTRKKSQPNKNGFDTVNRVNGNSNTKRPLSVSDSKCLPRSRSHTDDLLVSCNNLSRTQHIRHSYRLPRSPSSQWTPTLNSVNGHNQKNQTWSGFRGRNRPSISPDIFDSSNNNNNNYNQQSFNSYNGNKRSSEVKPVINSPIKPCPALLRELLCDDNLDTNEKVLQKMKKIVAESKQEVNGTTNELKVVPNDVILVTADNDEDYTKKWLKDVDKFSKDSSASTSQGIGSPDYESDLGYDSNGHLAAELANHQPQQTSTLNRKSIAVASPRKNNHPDTETKIPKPTYWRL